MAPAAEALGKRAIVQERDEGVCECGRRVRHHQSPAGEVEQSFGADARRDDRTPGREGLEDLEARPAAGPERSGRHPRTREVGADVRHGAADCDPVTRDRADLRRRVAADQQQRRRRQACPHRRPDLLSEPDGGVRVRAPAEQRDEHGDRLVPERQRRVGIPAVRADEQRRRSGSQAFALLLADGDDRIEVGQRPALDPPQRGRLE